MSRRLPLVDAAQRSASVAEVASARVELPHPSFTVEALELGDYAFVERLADALAARGCSPVLAVTGAVPGLKRAANLFLPRMPGDALAQLLEAQRSALGRPLLVVGDGAHAFLPTLSIRLARPGRAHSDRTPVDLLVAAPGELLAARLAAFFSLVRHPSGR